MEKLQAASTLPDPAVTLLVPTRNESANVGEFIDRVTRSLGGLGTQWDIVFADDSDDATPEVIAEVGRQGAPVCINHRSPADRLHSISGALLSALPMVTGGVVVVIDADLQHPPEVIPELIGPILSGSADVAIGTRYREGGSAEGLTGFWRRVASRGAGGVTRIMFPSLWRCSDLASGLFAFRRDLLDGVSLHPIGFKFLVELLVRGDPRTVAEIPYVFSARSGGLSKATIRDGLTLIRHLTALRFTSKRLRPVRLVVDGCQLDLATTGGPNIDSSVG